LETVNFSRDGHVLKPADWGVSLLQPGECIRIYGVNVPDSLPEGCARVFDYPGSEDERKFWFEKQIAVEINPNVRFFYPA
jgi:hypothetical protein